MEIENTSSHNRAAHWVQVGSLMAELIFDHMVHNSYFESAGVVARDLLDGAVEVSPKDRDEVRLRAGVAEALIAGHIEDAMSTAERVAPGVLQAHPSILFKLHCQKFMELVSGTSLPPRPYVPTLLGVHAIARCSRQKWIGPSADKLHADDG